MAQKKAHTLRANKLANMSIQKRMQGDVRASEAMAQASLNAASKRNAKALNILIRLLEEEHDNREKRLG